jgi:hypothetical protein
VSYIGDTRFKAVVTHENVDVATRSVTWKIKDGDVPAGSKREEISKLFNLEEIKAAGPSPKSLCKLPDSRNECALNGVPGGVALPGRVPVLAP